MYKTIPYDKHYINQFEVNATVENILDMLYYWAKKEDSFKVDLYLNTLNAYTKNLKAFKLYAYSFIQGYIKSIIYLENTYTPLINGLKKYLKEEKKFVKELIYNE